jgi:sporulation protein YlmC with PRC-barrel domain
MKGEKHAYSALARRNSDSADHSHHAAAPLRHDAVGAHTVHIAYTFHSSLTEENMIKYLATALLTTALITGAAYAQNKTTTSDSGATMHREGEWRASKLVGVNVYNEANEKIGDINEVILDKSGKTANVILGVGGFLGMGEHYVAVAYDKLKWVSEPVRTSTTTPPADKPTVGVNNAGAATGEVNRSNGPTRAANENWYPDHVVYNATKEQLKAMPQFKY